MTSFVFSRHTSMTTSPTASQSQVSTSSATHSMPNMDVRHVRSDVSDAARVSSSQCCDVIRVGGYHIANVYKPPTEHWYNTNLPPAVLPHPPVLVGDFNSHHPDWEYQEADLNARASIEQRLSVVARRQATWHVPLCRVAT